MNKCVPILAAQPLQILEMMQKPFAEGPLRHIDLNHRVPPPMTTRIVCNVPKPILEARVGHI